MTTLTHIEHECRLYADARQDLGAEVEKLNNQIEALKRAALPAIKRLVGRASERHSQLKARIEAAPDLFVRPRTVVFHGIKAGYQKGKGGLAYEDADKVVALIRKNFGDDAEAYLHIKVTPDKDHLAQLPAADLKKIGCHIVDAGDQVLIKPTDSAVDKIVNALLSEATEDAHQQVA